MHNSFSSAMSFCKRSSYSLCAYSHLPDIKVDQNIEISLRPYSSKRFSSRPVCAKPIVYLVIIIAEAGN